MSTYTFRLCTMEDKPQIVKFMDENWGSKHPLIHCDDFFNHYYMPDFHQSQESNKNAIQFAIACEDEKIIALAGYIFTSKTPPIDIWVSIWCAVKGKNGIGLELMDKLPSLTNCRVMACNNIRPKTMPFYTFLGYTAERLPHYYRLADCAEYKIARITQKNILPAFGNLELELVNDTVTLQQKYIENIEQKPHKDTWYITRRYFNYPYKKYEVYGVKSQKNAYDGCEKYIALLITYTAHVGNTNVLRIVDFIGESAVLSELGSAIDNLISAQKAEYADCYCYGISEEIFTKAGFCARTSADENIIPNYLDPPLFENTDYYFFTSDCENFTMFKADGDQDRPNIFV